MSESLCRKAVRERACGLCERCGQLGVQMHHRKNRSQGGAWTPANIVFLCVRCHKHITEHPLDAYAAGWSVRSGFDPADVAVKRWDVWVHLDDDGGYDRALAEVFGPRIMFGTNKGEQQ